MGKEHVKSADFKKYAEARKDIDLMMLMMLSVTHMENRIVKRDLIMVLRNLGMDKEADMIAANDASAAESLEGLREKIKSFIDDFGGTDD